MEVLGETTAGNAVFDIKNHRNFSVSAELSETDRLKHVAASAIDAATSELNQLSQEIWKNPELYFNEHKAHKLLTDFLEGKGFSVERSYKLQTAFRAKFANDDLSAPNVALLCEYDALPVIGHACGHNLIAEVGIGASLGVKAAMEQCGRTLGKLTVLGCPAEEEGGGKVVLIDSNAFADVDAAIMSHPSNFSAVETQFAALQAVRVVYRGVSSHAASEPASGVNALDAAVMAYSAISCLRQQMKSTYRVHGIITKGGTAPNMIPDEAELFYYIRAPTAGELDKLVKRVTACFEASALASGCKVQFIWDAHRFKDVITNRTMGNLYEKNAQRLGVKFSDYEIPDNVGSTDLGNVSYVVPAIHPHFYFGANVPEHSEPFVAQAGSADAQFYAIREAKILAFTAIDLLCDHSLISRAKVELEQDRSKRS